MQLLLPPPPSSISGVLQSLQGLWRSLQTAFPSVVSQNEAVARIILSSPNGTNYQLTVDDAGALVVTVAPKRGP